MTKLVKTLYDLLHVAIQYCYSDRDQTALQLSGGLDSAVIQAIAKLDHLYCVTFPEVDNLEEAKLAANGVDVIPVTFTKDEMIEVAIPEVARLTDGKGTWSQVCQWFLCRRMAQDGINVVLTGEGSDELFGGYARYRILWWIDQMRDDPHLEAYQGIINYMLGDDREILARMLSRNLPKETAQSIVADFKCNGSLLDDMASIEENTGLPDLLEYGRLMARTHGIDCRFPFMDSNVVNFAHSLPPESKINVWKNKAILRDVARELGIHSTIVYERTKKGLFVPPQWAPDGEPRWSRSWFTKLMDEAHGQS